MPRTSIQVWYLSLVDCCLWGVYKVIISIWTLSVVTLLFSYYSWVDVVAAELAEHVAHLHKCLIFSSFSLQAYTGVMLTAMSVWIFVLVCVCARVCWCVRVVVSAWVTSYWHSTSIAIFALACLLRKQESSVGLNRVRPQASVCLLEWRDFFLTPPPLHQPVNHCRPTTILCLLQSQRLLVQQDHIF